MTVLPDLIGTSQEIVAVRERVEQLIHVWSRSHRPPPILIQGETGSGKGLLARALHQASPRAGSPFVDVNCAAIPETLIEAELFGYERGAFTDARQSKPGLFQLAHRGTLFLDEIGLVPPGVQAKLLSVLEERSVRRLGGTRAEPADVWVIAATNEDLMQAMRERRFREDLYHRVAVVTLTLPPLRARGDDAIVLAEHFLARACAEYGLPPKALADDARRAIARHHWPGNVRELSNALERAAMLSATSELTAGDLALVEARPVPEAAGESEHPAAPAAPQSSRDILRDHLSRVLTETDWNISRTATILGVSRNTVTARIARFGLRGPSKAGAVSVAEPKPDASASRSPAPRAAHWDTRRLTFLRVEVLDAADRDELDGRMAPQLDVAAEKLRGFGGRVEGLGPRVLLASFGIEPSDEHALLAGHSALVIQRAVRDMVRDDGASPVKIGVHTAEVPVRVGARHTVIDPDAGRSAWNTLDSEMAGVEPCEIAATAAATALMRRRFALVPLDRGDATHRLQGLWRNDTAARAKRGSFAGRHAELAWLHDRFTESAHGQGQVVAVAGEAGIGKSRLLLELVGSPKLEGSQYLEGHCVPAEVQVPFLPLIQIVAAACGIIPTDTADDIAVKVTDALAVGGADAADAAASLVYLLGASTRAPEPPSTALKKRLFAAVQKLLFIKSGAAPMLVVVEDLQWIDPTSDACLAGLVESIGSARILLAVTYRTGYRPAWSTASKVSQLTLSPLSPEESVEVIRAILDGRAATTDVERKIQSWAEGNPLFLEELTHAARDRGDASLDARIPATIEDTIETRLAGLPWRLRRLISAAAVIGRDISLPLLREVVELPPDALDAALGELQAADFMYSTGLGLASARGTFKHALVQQTAYAKLSPSESRALHLRVLDAIERLYPDRIADYVERLAHHAVRAEASERAIRYLQHSASKAVSRFALAEAMAHLTRGVELLPKMADDAERDRQELDLRVAIGLVLSASRNPAAPESAQVFAHAMEIHRRVPNFPNLGTLLYGYWFSCLMRAQYSTARDLAERLRELVERDGDTRFEAFAYQSLGMTDLYQGHVSSARQHLEHVLELHASSTDAAHVVNEYGWPFTIYTRINCLAYLGRTLFCLGFPDRALARMLEAVAEAEAGGGALNTATAMGMLTTLHLLRREPAHVLDVTARTIAHNTEWGIAYWLAHGRLLRSVARQKDTASIEDTQHAVQELERTINAYRGSGATLGLTWFLSLLAETLGAAGRPAEGLAVIGETLALAETTGEGYHEAEAHRVKGMLMMQGAGDETVAELCFRQALDVARRQHAKAWELRAATQLAGLLERQKRFNEAREVLAPVYGWFSEGFATADLRDARAVLDRLGAGQ